MFIYNVTGKTIKDISFAGYMFTIPAGVSLVWDKFGEFLLNDIYKQQGEGTAIPPVIAATAKQWKGVLYADIRRYEIDSNLIPSRPDLIKIAKKRGVTAEQIEQWNEDETIDNGEIARVINDIEVPEEIKYPVVGEEVAETTATDIADEILTGADDGDDTDANAPESQETTPTTPTPVAPKTAAKKTAAKKKAPGTARKAAKK